MKKFFLLLSVIAMATLCIQATARASNQNQNPFDFSSMALYYINFPSYNIAGLGVTYTPNGTGGSFTFGGGSSGGGTFVGNGTGGTVSGNYNGNSFSGTVTGLSSSGGTYNPDNGSGGGTFTMVDPPSPTPEPATMMLLGTGLIGLAVAFRKKASRNV